MTAAFDLLMQGEFLRAVITLYADLTSEPFLFFMGLCGFTAIVWATTDSMPFAIMMFMIVSSSLVLSHLVQFQLDFAIIPQEWQLWLLLIAVIAVGGLLWYALVKRVQ